MPKKVFECNACDETHERPINSKCKHVIQVNNTDGEVSDVSTVQSDQMDINKQILDQLKLLNGRIEKVEQKVEVQDNRPFLSPKSVHSEASSLPSTQQKDSELLLPSLNSLKQSKQIQQQVDARLQELHTISQQGKFKSQRGGGEIVWCKKEIPWPQNSILSGSTKSRVSYDNLTMAQWVSGFSTIIREEQNVITKNFMLEYLSDIMDDCNDFGWQSGKGAHAVLLCKMEDNNVDWHETSKIDRIRRVHAQKIPNLQGRRTNKEKSVPCKYFQKGSCGQKSDHENNGQMYLHVCATCFASGKSHPHTAKKCRRSKNDHSTA